MTPRNRYDRNGGWKSSRGLTVSRARVVQTIGAHRLCPGRRIPDFHQAAGERAGDILSVAAPFHAPNLSDRLRILDHMQTRTTRGIEPAPVSAAKLGGALVQVAASGFEIHRTE